MYIAAKILLTYLATLTAPDLCDVVHSQTGTPTICVPHEDRAPVYDADVCCAGSTCKPTTATSACVTGQKRFYCELGVVDALGIVSCYFEVPNYCDVFPCELEIGAGPLQGTICCENGICTPYAGGGSCDSTNVYHCLSVHDNGDGTVTCLDWE
jgi:hypothetical protein